MTRWMLFSVTLAILAPLATAADAPKATDDAEVKTIRVLAVGNSFTANSTKFLRQIVKADGRFKLEYQVAYIGGCSLQRHWRLAAEHEADATKGKPYRGKSLKDLLTSKQWDVVTIQQVSTQSDKPDTYQPYGNNLAAYIRKYAPTAEIWIHETWAYRADDAEKGKLAKDYPDAENPQLEMWKNLRKNYHQLAKDVEATKILPIGDAFQNARAREDFRFVKDPNYDYANPEHPKLPDQSHSLNSGHRWHKRRDGTWSLSCDTHHANQAGEYLGGLVWFECLFGEPPTGEIYAPKGVSAEDAKILQDVAHQTVSDPANTTVEKKADAPAEAVQAAGEAEVKKAAKSAEAVLKKALPAGTE